MPKADAVPNRTRREEIRALLSERAWYFEELRAYLAVAVLQLEDDLQHLARSLRRGEARIRLTACRCADCDYEFRGRAPQRFRTPGRCPRCRGESIRDARLEVVPR